MSDPRDEIPHGRRWDDIIAAIAIAVNQAMTPFRLTLDRLDDELARVKTSLFGDPVYRQAGALDRLDKIENRMGAMEGKLDQLIQQSQERSAQMTGARKALTVLAAVIALVGGPPAIITLLRTFGVSI
jgi:hypothetical protein